MALMPGDNPENMVLEEAERRIEEIVEELAHGDPSLKKKNTSELLSLTQGHAIVPTSYKLEGVVRVGDHVQRVSRVSEMWKGSYKGELVALKVTKVSRRDPHLLGVKMLFCRQAVLMKQEHENILPFYGVSTIAPFCLVSAWRENGNIIDYLGKRPDVNPFDLACTFGQTPHS
jgi:hypothetical protein